MQGSLADFFWSSECENILNFSKNHNHSESIEKTRGEDQQFWLDRQILQRMVWLIEVDLCHRADLSLHNVGWEILLIEVSWHLKG